MHNEVLKEHARNIRKMIIEMIHAANSGHPGGALSAADVMTYLYFEKMDITKENVDSRERDRFILSKGHASAALYATLKEKGLLDEDIHSFRKIDSKLQGHPSMQYLAGVDMTTGSLGQGSSVAVGMALADKLDQNGHHVYCLLGDGESEEGLVWEAMMAAHHYGLSDLTYILDFNHLQIDGRIEDVIDPTPFKEKFEAFGLATFECDGHDFDSIREAFKKASEVSDRPQVIIAHTIKGKGVSFMEDQASWHGSAPNDEEYMKAIEELDREDA